MPRADADPARRLMQRVRAGLTLQGTSFTAWCRAHNTDPSQARQAIYGTWAGPKGRALRHRLLQAAGVVEGQS